MYDLIGDIHGHADALVNLLEKLGYSLKAGAFRHPERRVIFLGDYIDRGPKIAETVQIVRDMVESETALAIMGNHELNALAFHLPHPHRQSEHLRPHNPKNEKQHGQTLAQLTDGQLSDALTWFRTLPMWLDLPGIRAVHACWDDVEVANVQSELQHNEGVSNRFLELACLPGNPLFKAVEVILKGKELALPEGISFSDKDGNVRTKTRTRWYLSPEGQTFGSYAMTDQIACDVPLSEEAKRNARPYEVTEKPVFVGHYWLRADTPEPLAANVACLDYSVAKGGYLCAYRWLGERQLSSKHYARAV
ncbi:diadenosine tetraphosphatase [bacterium]|nr:diadenosine tetraphosphatase [bacterium]